MNHTYRTSPIITQVEAEHRQLHARLDEIRQLLRRAPANQLESQRVRFVELLYALRDFLHRHFVTEDRGGYLEEAGARVPRLSARIAAIERQHVALANQLGELIEQAEEAAPTPTAWHGLSAAFFDFRRQLLAHEASEHRILQEGFNEDLSALD
jgi:iron-sulfur cluster repair protein YtfE (RIC family)